MEVTHFSMAFFNTYKYLAHYSNLNSLFEVQNFKPFLLSQKEDSDTSL